MIDCDVHCAPDSLETLLAHMDPYWRSYVDDATIADLGPEPVTVHIGTPADERGTRVRYRLRTTTRVNAVSGSSIRRAWFATAEGMVGLRRLSTVEVIASSGAFDVEYYRSQVPALPLDVDPVRHYVETGARDGLEPCEMFDTSYYRRMNPDLRGNLFGHFCEYGWRQLRNPSPQFDVWWYWSKHLDAAEAGTNPLAH